MKKYSIVGILLLSVLLVGCNSSNKKVTAEHTDDFIRLEKEADTNTSDSADNASTVVDDKPFEIKENNDSPEYTEEELQRIEEEYNNTARPNYILDDEEDAEATDNSSEDTSIQESTIEEKTVTIDGEEFTIYVNE